MAHKTKRGRRLAAIWLNYVLAYEPQVGQVVNVAWRDSLRKVTKHIKGELLEVKPMGLCIEIPGTDEIFVPFMSIRALEKHDVKDYLSLAYKAGEAIPEEVYAVPVEEKVCPTCNGRKTVDKPKPAIGELLCPKCEGTGSIYE